MLGRNEEATDLHRRALQAFQSAGNEQGVAWTTMCLAVQAIGTRRRATGSATRCSGIVVCHRPAPAPASAALIILVCWRSTLATMPEPLTCAARSVELARPLGDRWLLGNSSGQSGREHRASRRLRRRRTAAARGSRRGTRARCAGQHRGFPRVTCRRLRRTAPRRDRPSACWRPPTPTAQTGASALPRGTATQSNRSSPRRAPRPARSASALPGRAGQSLTLTQVVHEVLNVSSPGTTGTSSSPIAEFIHSSNEPAESVL